jgi:hypothetical protein
VPAANLVQRNIIYFSLVPISVKLSKPQGLERSEGFSKLINKIKLILSIVRKSFENMNHPFMRLYAPF